MKWIKELWDTLTFSDHYDPHIDFLRNTRLYAPIIHIPKSKRRLAEEAVDRAWETNR